MTKPPDREIEEVRAGLRELHRAVGTFASEVLAFDLTWWRAFDRRSLRKLEERLETQFTTFMNLDADLLAHANWPSDINTAMRSAAHFQVDCGVRDSVRGLLTDTAAAVGSLRSQADFRSSLALSVAAIVLALASAVFDIGA